MQWLNEKKNMKKTVAYLNIAVKSTDMSKRTDSCIERWWQGVGVGEVQPTTKL